MENLQSLKETTPGALNFYAGQTTCVTFGEISTIKRYGSRREYSLQNINTRRKPELYVKKKNLSLSPPPNFQRPIIIHFAVKMESDNILGWVSIGHGYGCSSSAHKTFLVSLMKVKDVPVL
uniref:Uncharacterized protein n=1 Tax=Micrurus corallinus TaxID=54390 RepID=A0A2D4GGV7_MICCO